MNRAILVPLLFVLVVSMIPVSNLQNYGVRSVDAQSSSLIIVQVTDQNGLFYNGVLVQIWQQSGSLLYAGATANGFFSSGDLSANTNYLVIVNSGFQSENQTVFVGSTNTLVKFVLTRPPSPSLSISAINFIPSVISPGSTFVAQLTLDSSSVSTAYYSSITFNSSNPNGISVTGTGSTINIGPVAGNSTENLNVTFVVQAAALSGNYEVPYMLNYQDSVGNHFNSTGYVAVPVAGVPSRPLLMIAAITFNPSIVTPGATFVTSVNITNVGSQTAYGSSIGLSITGQTITLIGSTGQVNMGTLLSNSSEVVNFQMTSPFSAQAGAVPIDFTLIYNNKLGTVFTSNGTFSIQLSAAPDLQVQSFSLSSSPLVPGGSSDLTVNILNAGGDSAYNVGLTVVGSAFLTGNSSNYLGTILSQATGKAVFLLNVANTTTPGSYNFTLMVTYKDLEGHPFSLVDNYSLTVAAYPSPSISITNIMVNPPVLSTGLSGSITLFFKNFGTTTANNVTVQVVGGNGIVSSSYFGLGTISSGGQVTQVIGVNVDPKAAPGNHAMVFNVTYADATGKVYHSSVPMNITIYASPNLFSLRNILIVVGGVIVVLGGSLFLRKRQII